MTYNLSVFYKDKNEMAEFLSADILKSAIENAKIKRITVCNRGFKCVGSLPNGLFLYEDGSKDFGALVNDYTSMVKLYNDSGDILIFEIGWTEQI